MGLGYHLRFYIRESLFALYFFFITLSVNGLKYQRKFVMTIAWRPSIDFLCLCVFSGLFIYGDDIMAPAPAFQQRGSPPPNATKELGPKSKNTTIEVTRQDLSTYMRSR